MIGGGGEDYHSNGKRGKRSPSRGFGLCLGEEGARFNGSVLYLTMPQEIRVEAEELRIPEEGLVLNARLKELSGEGKDVRYF